MPYQHLKFNVLLIHIRADDRCVGIVQILYIYFVFPIFLT